VNLDGSATRWPSNASLPHILLQQTDERDKLNLSVVMSDPNIVIPSASRCSTEIIIRRST
jgi:hypothetical protein